ncbi:hypothetical protein G8770_15670 [Aestuariicella hydrocarbonica]|uniref:Uncharacterized protein n=1 Tax=Pseudomaricurvus hydrocarbonicus TaxID=1470433 RepID=A0A9E5JUV6_9GAMM|nr:hypothetical protein [Aestuariicella hydrocarbonica]NHO66989.1 hypothetical protein [Aestuariicella hydrocarbonica]
MLSPTVLNLIRTPLFIISITTLVCLLLSASLLQQQHHQRLEIRTLQYGNALATLGASQATDATLNHDLVSLQVTVSDIARNPDVLSATIHDVENRLLVQAGDSPNAGDYVNRDYGSYSAPITLQDSVAGYLTVIIDKQTLYEEQDDTWLMALLGLAGAMLVMSVLNLRQTPTESPADPENQEAPLTSPPARDNQLPTRSMSIHDDVDVNLTLRCLNWPTLKQQLSATLRQQLFDDLQRHLSGINALYNGRILFADHETLELQFRGDEIGNTTFRAICAAYLLFSLVKQSNAGIRLDYAAAAYPATDDNNLHQYLDNSEFRQQLQAMLAEQTNHSLLIDTQECATSQLLQRLQVNEFTFDQSWAIIEGLQPTYQGLLDKQAKHLQSLQTA